MAMIRPETEMKDSGIEWIGDIPSNWETTPLKKIVVDRAGGAWGNEPYENNSTICMRIADFDFDRGVFQDKSETELTKRSYKEYQIDKLLLQTNDICIEKSGGGEKTPVGRAVLFDKPYDALFANFMDRIRVDNAVSFPKYVEYYLRAMYFLSVTTLYIKQTTGIQNLNVTSLLEKEVITLPSLSEQQAIADYLDETCSKIDEIIAEAKASIDEYKEVKQSVIFEAVTKGLGENVELKDSGAEGMGTIPASWSVVRFMKVNYVRARLGWKGLKAEEYVDIGYPFLAAYHIVNSHLRWENLNCITKERYDESPEIKLSIGDLVLVKDGAGIGKCARIDDMPLGEATVNSSLSVITPNELLDYRYEYYYFMSPLFQNIIARLKNGMGVPHLTQESMKDIYLPLPSKKEQQAIADYLDNKVVELDTLIAEKESLINDLEAYKKSLIYEVVTGKRRVV